MRTTLLAATLALLVAAPLQAAQPTRIDARALAQIQQVLAPLGIEWMPGKGDPESDIGAMAQRGMAWAWLGHDGIEYFDLHHNAEDTLDKIDPKGLAQNTAAYAVFTWLAAQAEGGFGSEAKAAAKD